MQISNRTVYAALVLAALCVVGLVGAVLAAPFGAMPDNALDRLKASFVSGNPAAADGDPIQRVALWIPPGGASGTITVAASSAAGITNPVNVSQWNGTTTRLGAALVSEGVPVNGTSTAASAKVDIGLVNAAAAAAAADNTSNPTSFTFLTTGHGYNSTRGTWDRLRVGETNQSATTGILNIMGGRQHVLADAAAATLTDYVGSVNAVMRAENGSGTVDVVRIGNQPAAFSLPVTAQIAAASGQIQVCNSSASCTTVANPSDTISNTNPGMTVIGFTMGYNVNNNIWERCRSSGQTNVSASTGLCVSLPVGQYNATANAITDSRFNHFQLDANGSLRVNPAGQIPTYAAASAAIALATSPTDVFTITGSSTKTVKVRRIVLSGVQTTAGAASMSLILRSTANSGGTSVTPAVTPLDFNDAAGTATVRAYTANPTVGTQAGVIDTRWLTMLAPATAAETPNVVFDFSERSEKAVVLRGTGQVLAVNFHGTTVTGGSVSAAVTWTEE